MSAIPQVREQGCDPDNKEHEEEENIKECSAPVEEEVEEEEDPNWEVNCSDSEEDDETERDTESVW